MRKRSKYRPKGVIRDTMTWVKAGLKKVDDISAGTTLKIRNYDAMNNLRTGTATRRDIDAIIDAMNVAEALAKRGVGGDWLEEIQDAQDKLLELARRGVANDSRFIVRGEELKALNLGMEIHDAQLDAVTVRELELAMQDVMENLRTKRMRPIIVTKK
ncbi:MAG: hypothetical protein ACKO0Z_28005 [Betaproteobacteria bacterium]